MIIPGRDVPSSAGEPSYEELAVENARLRKLIEVQAERISEWEKLVEEVRRSGKSQAAPFPKGIRKATPSARVASPVTTMGPKRAVRSLSLVRSRSDL